MVGTGRFELPTSRTQVEPAGEILSEAKDLLNDQGMVGAVRFELTTPCAQGRCATRLRYTP